MNRTKVTVACQACQKKKVKCTGSSPCTNCSRSGNACIFSNTAKKRGPRNGNVEVIKSSAHRIENVLLNYPSLRDQIEQMLERNSNKNGNHHNKRSQSRSLHSMRLGLSSQKNHVLDDDKHNGRVSSFPYPVSKKSLSHHDDVIIKPQRRQDQVDRQENHPSPIFCRPLPVYPSNMQRNHASTDDFSSQRSDIHRYAQAGPPTSHSNTSEVVVSSTTNPLLPPFAKMETSSIQMKDQKPDDENHLTLPVPHSLLLKRKPTSSVYNTSLGTPLLLPAPDLENPLDALHKSLISNSSLHQQEGLLPQNNHNDSLESKIILADWNEMINDNEKKSVTCTKISLPSPPSYISLSSSPRSTCTNYPPTPTSSVSPPLSPPTKSIPINSFTSKRSSIHLLSKPAPWCANVVSEDRINRSHNELMEMNG